MTPEDAERLRQIRARLEEISEGPWQHIKTDAVVFVAAKDGTPGKIIVASPGWSDDESITLDEEHSNCAFIANARDDVPWLLARLEERVANAPEKPD